MWSWIFDSLLPSVTAAGIIGAIAWAAYKRTRLTDDSASVESDVLHLLTLGVKDLQRIRISLIPWPSWRFILIIRAWWKHESVFAMLRVTYDVAHSEFPQVYSAKYVWGIAPTATDFYNAVAQGSEAMQPRLTQQHLHTINWQQHERGCVVWVRTQFAGKRSYLMQQTAREVSAAARDEFYQELEAFKAGRVGEPIRKKDVFEFGLSKVDDAERALLAAKDDFWSAPRGPGTRIDHKVNVCVQRARLRTFKRCRRESVHAVRGSAAKSST